MYIQRVHNKIMAKFTPYFQNLMLYCIPSTMMGLSICRKNIENMENSPMIRFDGSNDVKILKFIAGKSAIYGIFWPISAICIMRDLFRGKAKRHVIPGYVYGK